MLDTMMINEILIYEIFLFIVSIFSQ